MDRLFWFIYCDSKNQRDLKNKFGIAGVSMGTLGTIVSVYQATMVTIVKWTSMSAVLIRVWTMRTVMMK